MRPVPELGQAVADLVRDGVLAREHERLRTTRRWQGAMARAARALQEAGAEFDLRRPIAMALIDLLGAHRDDRELARYVAVLLPFESASLDDRPS